MHKKELILLLLLPVLAFLVSLIGYLYFNSQSEKLTTYEQIVNEIQYFVSKVTAETPKETKDNLISHIKSTEKLLLNSLKTEKEFISDIRGFMFLTLVYSFAWGVMLILVQIKINKRINE